MATTKTKKTNDSEELALVPAVMEEPSPSSPEISGFALVELFGHQRIVGFTSQQTFASGVLFRVDVPDLLKNGKVTRKGFTRYFGLGAIYSITPIDRETVMAMLPGIDGTPGDARPLSIKSYGRDDDY